MKRILLGMVIFSTAAAAFSQENLSTHFSLYSRCRMNQACWPNTQEWGVLEKQLSGNLIKPISPISECYNNSSSSECHDALKEIHNPFINESNPGATQSQGWLSAWRSFPSVYAVEAKSVQDVVAAVTFAHQHKLKLVIKGTGHDYIGRSNAADSLLIWTHKMRDMKFESTFIPAGCSNTKGVSAITIGAGTRWLDVYKEATVKHHQYVQGGGCTTVGAAGGFTQGGGFGSFSKKFGTGAAGLLQAEIVTANGEVLIANQCQNQDLFWAIRGGGGGTFGVVTKMTLKTHPLPKEFGVLEGKISAKNKEAYKVLIQHFLIFYHQYLNNEFWGEQFAFTQNNSINLALVFQGLNETQVKKMWEPLEKWLHRFPDKYSITMHIHVIPAEKWWDEEYLKQHYPKYISVNPLRTNEFWWAGNSNEVANYWYTYQSWWLPIKLFENAHIKQLTDIFYKASRLTTITLHINKGLAGASAEAIKASHSTATNPSMFNAAGLIILAAGSNTIYPGVLGKEPNLKKGKQLRQNVSSAMQLFTQAAPDAGTYVNEADYFLNDWQKAFWGNHYTKLLAIKQKYDPEGVFYCHHCVGSELWINDGMRKIR